MKNKLRLIWLKTSRFEFWPVYVFYAPFIFYWLWLSLRARDPFFLLKVNPGIPFGGAFGACKQCTLSQLPEHWTPKSLYFKKDTSLFDVFVSLEKSGINYPFIVKPDAGERGKGVEYIRSPYELEAYLLNQQQDLIIQEFIDYPLEFGVFFYRDPKTMQARISSITGKELLKVTGDGIHSLRELANANPRAQMHLNGLSIKHGAGFEQIPACGKEIILENIGNHCRGTIFRNNNHLINEKVVALFERIASNIEGFEYGRFDLKAESAKSLESGNGLKILEVNGVNSEPAHIYDPNYRLNRAWADVKRQFDLMYRISKKNKALYNNPSNNWIHVIQSVRNHFRPLV